jgi:hypothetical protein
VCDEVLSHMLVLSMMTLDSFLGPNMASVSNKTNQTANSLGSAPICIICILSSGGYTLHFSVSTGSGTLECQYYIYWFGDKTSFQPQLLLAGMYVGHPCLWCRSIFHG